VSCLNCSSVRTFRARLSISRQISLKTRSAHPFLASSISCLHAMKIVSFMACSGSFKVCVFSGVFLLGFWHANSLRYCNMDLQYAGSAWFLVWF